MSLVYLKNRMAYTWGILYNIIHVSIYIYTREYTNCFVYLSSMSIVGIYWYFQTSHLRKKTVNKQIMLFHFYEYYANKIFAKVKLITCFKTC